MDDCGLMTVRVAAFVMLNEVKHPAFGLE